MEPKTTEMAALYKAWAWFDANKKQVAWGAGLVAGVALVVWFYLGQKEEKAIKASEAVADVLVKAAGPGRVEMAAAYLQIANQDPASSAGTRALLLAAGSLFADGKFSEAQTQFDRFIREHRDSPFYGEAMLGVAACLDAQNKTNEALTAYKNLVERRPNDLGVPQAKFALARIYESQDKPEQALALFEEINRLSRDGELGREAGMRAEELMIKYPNLAPKPPTPANLPAATPAPTVSIQKNPPSTSGAGTATTNIPVLKIPSASNRPAAK